jgi:hypothetical protein
MREFELNFREQLSCPFHCAPRRGEVERAYSVAGNYRPTGRADSYRDHARQCLDAAVHAASVDTCSAFLELAFGWTRLAKRLEAESIEAESLGDALQSVSVVFIKPRRD